MIKKKDLIKILCFILIFVTIISILGESYQQATWHDLFRVKGLYLEPKNSIDVCIIGSSEVFTGFSPVQAWKNYGFTSYDYGTVSEPISVYEHSIKEVLKRQHPKCLVIELYPVTYEDDVNVKESYIRRYEDAVYESFDRYSTIWKLKKSNFEDYLFSSIAKYHNNYSDPFSVLFYYKSILETKKQGYSYTKGMAYYTKKINEEVDAESVILDIKNDNSTSKLTKENEKYLLHLLDFLEENGYGKDNVLFVLAPHYFTKETYYIYQRSNTAGNLVEEKGYTFLNFSDNISKYGLVREEDFANNFHLNIFGQEKYTGILSEYIVNNYDVINNKSDEVKNNWNNSYEVCENLKQRILQDRASYALEVNEVFLHQNGFY